MDRIVADSSVMVKLFMEEEYSDKAYDLRDAYISKSVDVIEPSLLEYEVMNALLYSKRLEMDDINSAIKAIDEYSFMTVQMDHNLASKVVELAQRHRITVYDATYVALAMSFNAYMFTADDRLIRKVKLPLLKHIKDFR